MAKIAGLESTRIDAGGRVTYTVYVEGGFTKVVDETVVTGADGRLHIFATTIAALNWCRDNGPAEGTTIWIKPPLSTTPSYFIINRSNLTILTGLDGSSGQVILFNILLDAENVNIRNIVIEGVKTYRLWFRERNSHFVGKCYFFRVMVEATASATGEGIVFGGDGTGYVHHIYFDHCFFSDGGQSARGGFISFTRFSYGTGQIYFRHCRYENAATAKPYVFLALEDEGVLGPTLSFDHLSIYIQAGGTSFTFYRHYNQTNAAKIGIMLDLKVHHCWFEWHVETTLIYIEASTQNTRLKATFEDNAISPGGIATHTLINNLNANWAQPSLVSWHHNVLVSPAVPYAIGTPNENANFTVEVHHNEVFNPVGVVATPFDNVSNFIEIAGAAAVPLTDVVYTVRNCDIKLSSTNSGSADCDIMIKDQAGNNILQATLSSIEEMYIPRGFQITWGTFTGAAPTVTVAFV